MGVAKFFLYWGVKKLGIFFCTEVVVSDLSSVLFRESLARDEDVRPSSRQRCRSANAIRSDGNEKKS